MNARELSDWLTNNPITWRHAIKESDREMIIRALRLLAAAESGEGTPETDALQNAACNGADAILSVGGNPEEPVRMNALLQEAYDHARRLERERNALAARVAELEAALDRYGCHADSCGDMDAMNGAEIKSCNCGLDAARSK